MKFADDIYTLVKELELFDYKIEYSDHIWDIIFPDKKGKWHHARVTKYHSLYYLGLIDDDICTLEIKPGKSIDPDDDDTASDWGHLIASLKFWLNTVKKNWIKANKQVQENYPLNHR